MQTKPMKLPVSTWRVIKRLSKRRRQFMYATVDDATHLLESRMDEQEQKPDGTPPPSAEQEEPK